MVAAGAAGGVWLVFDSGPEPLPIPGSGTPFVTPSLELTVVELTCLLPDDLRPLDEPEELGECNEPRDADRGKAELGGLPPVLLGEPGGKLSATDIKAAIGLWLLPP